MLGLDKIKLLASPTGRWAFGVHKVWVGLAFSLQTPVGAEFVLVDAGREIFNGLVGQIVLIDLGLNQVFEDTGTIFPVGGNLDDAPLLLEVDARIAGLATLKEHELGILGTFSLGSPIWTLIFFGIYAWDKAIGVSDRKAMEGG